jgi:protein ImuA
MTPAAMARRDVVSALRHTIASIEGRPACRLDAPGEAAGERDDVMVRRSAGVAGVESAGTPGGRLLTGAGGFDAALGGGLPLGGLTEIHTAETRDAGSAAGFALALCARLPKDVAGPVLWIGTREVFHEAGLPYAIGIASLFGLAPERLLVACGQRAEDALWIAGEAAGLPDLAAVVLELRGAPRALDLTATRRLHRRAQLAGRPVLFLRPAGAAQPTAAPVRLVAAPAAAAARETVAGPLPGTLGRPAFSIAIAKSRQTPAHAFTLEWDRHELRFREPVSRGDTRAKDPGGVASQPRRPAGAAAAAGVLLAFDGSSGLAAAAGGEPAGGQRAAHRRARSAR